MRFWRWFTEPVLMARAWIYIALFLLLFHALGSTTVIVGWFR